MLTINLPVDDLERATRFYTDWGWTPSDQSKPGKASFFELQVGFLLALYPRHLIAQALDLPLTQGILLTRQVENLDEVDTLFNIAIASGARMLKRPAQQPWGGYSGFLADPEKNPWEICWNPQC